MATWILPTPSAERHHWLVKVPLQKQDWIFEWHWNSRAEYWTCSLSMADGTPIAAGRVMKPTRGDLFASSATIRPRGVFGVVWGNQSVAIPGLADWGAAKLVFVEVP